MKSYFFLIFLVLISSSNGVNNTATSTDSIIPTSSTSSSLASSVVDTTQDGSTTPSSSLTYVTTTNTTNLRRCSAGSSTHAIPVSSTDKGALMVTNSKDAIMACNNIQGIWEGITSMNIQSLSQLAYDCLGFGNRVALASWNTDTYQGIGVQMYLFADKQQLPHIGLWDQLTPSAPLCRLRSPLTNTQPPLSIAPKIKVLLAPDSNVGINHQEAVQLCTSHNSILADLSIYDSSWNIALSLLYTLLGPGHSAWARSWDKNTYMDSCLAITVGMAKESGTINVPPQLCYTQLPAAICIDKGIYENDGRSLREQEVLHDIQLYGIESVLGNETISKLLHLGIGTTHSFNNNLTTSTTSTSTTTTTTALYREL